MCPDGNLNKAYLFFVGKLREKKKIKSEISQKLTLLLRCGHLNTYSITKCAVLYIIYV